MLVQLHKALITNPNFVHNCPGYSSWSIAELGWMQCKVCVKQIPKRAGGQFATSCFWSREERLWPMPRPLTECLWIKQQSLDSVITKLQPLCWIFPFCVLLRDAVCKLPLSPRGISLERNAMCYCSNACLDDGITKTPHQQRKLKLFINCL